MLNPSTKNTKIFWSYRVLPLTVLLIGVLFFCGVHADGAVQSDSTEKSTIGDSEAELADLRLKAEQGTALAQYKLGFKYFYGQGVTKNHVESAKWFRKSAEQGNLKSVNNLGILYANGLGVKKDHKEAFKWSRKAAEQGYAPAQFRIGEMYSDGRGVGKDKALAIEWYRKAAEQGDVDALMSLSTHYLDGIGVVKDEAEAIKWCRLAAEQGDAKAQDYLGYMLLTAKQETEAAKWFRKAANQGSRNSQYNLGIMYFKGDVLPKNDLLARVYLRKAAEQNDGRAKQALQKHFPASRQIVSGHKNRSDRVSVVSATMSVNGRPTLSQYAFGSNGVVYCSALFKDTFEKAGDSVGIWKIDKDKRVVELKRIAIGKLLPLRFTPLLFDGSVVRVSSIVQAY